MMISLVNQDVAGFGEFLDKRLQIFSRGERGGRVIRVTNIVERRRGGSAPLEHAFEVVGVFSIQAHRYNVSPAAMSTCLHCLEGGRSLHQLFADAEKRESSDAQDFG